MFTLLSELSAFQTMQTDMTPKLTLAILLLLSCLTLGSTLKNRYIRQDSGYTDDSADCSADLDETLAAAGYPRCANSPSLKTGHFEDFLRDLVCDEECGIPLLLLFVAQCPYEGYPEVAMYYRQHCKVNARGQPCYSYLNNSELDTSVVNPVIALQLCKPSITYNTCSNKCRAQLRAIGTHYGSCIEPLFNSSYFYTFENEHLPLFSYQLWTRCGVPLPTAVN